MGDKALINVGDFAKPVNTLLEKISDAIGGFYRPHQIVRLAEAEGEAEKIRAVTQIEITELQRRAMRRFIAEEAKRQQNMESITAKALPGVVEQANPENVDDDWITHFFDKCRLISDEQMQDIWARLLAGEANVPGSYSRATIALLASLDKSDAAMFSLLAGFTVSTSEPIPLIYDHNDEFYTSRGIQFEMLSHLDTLGLIDFSSFAGFSLQGLKQKGYITYGGQRLYLEFPSPEKNTMQIGKVLFTRAGKELVRVCHQTIHAGFPEYLGTRWRSLGYKTEPGTETVEAARK